MMKQLCERNKKYFVYFGETVIVIRDLMPIISLTRPHNDFAIVAVSNNIGTSGGRRLQTSPTCKKDSLKDSPPIRYNSNNLRVTLPRTNHLSMQCASSITTAFKRWVERCKKHLPPLSTHQWFWGDINKLTINI